jgi:ribonuclease Z
MYAIITGTGYPPPDAFRAGPGVLVIADGGITIQFDCGRGTTMRHAALRVSPAHIDAVFLTHYHSDHVSGLPDLALSRWEVNYGVPYRPLEVVAPSGPTAEFARRMLEPYQDNLHVRSGHTAPSDSECSVIVREFEPDARRPKLVWRKSHVRVYAIKVRHEPVVNAVAYKVCTPRGNIVISGDTRVCSAIKRLSSRNTHTVIHEAILPADEKVGLHSYHANTFELGRQMSRVNIEHLVLTHLIPPPNCKEDEQRFIDSVRQGGFQGRITVAQDLMDFYFN